MIDDIVAKLRRVPERVPTGMGLVGWNSYYRRCQDAADEIEHLREEASCWQETAYELARQLGKREYADAEYATWKEIDISAS